MPMTDRSQQHPQQSSSNHHDSNPDPSLRAFAWRAAAACGIASLFLLLIVAVWFAGRILLVIFAAILFAAFLTGASRKLGQWLSISRSYALVAVLVLLAVLLGLAGYFLAPRVAAQIDPLISTIPSSIQQLRDYLRQYGWADQVLQTLPNPQQLISDASGMLSQARAVFSGVLGIIANIAIIFFVGVYLAAQPHIYMDGLLRLLPKRNREHGNKVLTELGLTLELWLLGKMISMIVVGVTTAIGLTLLGVPLAITLGVIAGLFDFIPYLGPILAGVPAVLMAFSQSPQLALYTVILFIGIQTAESYLLAPLIDRQTVYLPPALTITMQVLFAVPFGLLGVALATPLTAVLAVLIAMVYVRDVLDDQVPTPGDKPIF
jgi:predicted PurR-regulated permease PerM